MTKYTKVEKLERDELILNSVIAGLNYHEIERRYKIPVQTARRVFKQYLEKSDTLVQNVEKFRAVGIERTEKLFNACYERALQGDLKAIAVALKILKRQAMYLSLDEPPKVESSGITINFALADFSNPSSNVVTPNTIIEKTEKLLALSEKIKSADETDKNIELIDENNIDITIDNENIDDDLEDIKDI